MNKLAFSILIASSTLASGITECMPIRNNYEEAAVDSIEMKRKKKSKRVGADAAANAHQQQSTDLHTYISATATGSLGNSQIVQSLAPIIFNNTVSVSGKFTNDSTGIITAVNPGTYEVTFGGQWNSSNSQSFVALRVNGEVISGSTIPGGGWHTLTLFIDSKAINTTFEVINNSSDASNVIVLAGDGSQENNSTAAFITIRKL